MIAEDALFDVFTAAIESAAIDSPFFECALFSSTRGSAADADRTIRVQTLDGLLSPHSNDQLKEQKVKFVVQNLVKAAAPGLEAEQDAQAAADELMKASFDLLVNDPTLAGAVCDLSFFDGEENFSRMVIDIGATKYGSGYLFGTINP